VSRFSSVAASAVPLILGAALVGIAFGAEGGTELTRTSVTGVLMVFASGAVIAAAFLWGRAGSPHGMTTLLLFALLAFLTAASILWSIVPELSYVEAGRTFSYLGVFAAAVAGVRLAPRAAPQLLLGILIAATIAVAYALASRVWPGALAENEVSNRLGQPFDYWNAVGCVAAMAVPITLWL
jgi:MFS family permease